MINSKGLNAIVLSTKYLIKNPPCFMDDVKMCVSNSVIGIPFPTFLRVALSANPYGVASMSMLHYQKQKKKQNLIDASKGMHPLKTASHNMLHF